MMAIGETASHPRARFLTKELDPRSFTTMLVTYTMLRVQIDITSTTRQRHIKAFADSTRYHGYPADRRS